MPPPTVLQVLGLIDAGRAADALRIGTEIVRLAPRNARARMAVGIAQRMLGQAQDARSSLEAAAALDPNDYAVAFELGTALDLCGDADAALASHGKALALRPDFRPARLASARLLAQAGRAEEALAALAPAIAANPDDAFARHEKGWILHRAGKPSLAIPDLEASLRAHPARLEWALDLAKALADTGRDEEARSHYEQVVGARAGGVDALLAYARFCVSRGAFERAASLFGEASRQDPANPALPIYHAQAELVQGRWASGWLAYSRRPPRREFEAARAARGLPYRVPTLAEMKAAQVVLVGEQGLGDALFYLRFASELAANGANLRFTGDRRLASLLRRSGLFAEIRAGDAMDEVDSPLPILLGDLPAVEGIAPVPGPLRIAPDAARLRSWRERLESAGPRPWIGIAWRAGTPSERLAHGLYKTVPIEGLCRAIRSLGGTVFSLQRDPAPGEVAAAGDALGRPVHDLAAMNDELEDALAVVALLDRHVAVSNTNVHLAAAAGAAADVLVPFPPEWRWGAGGPSPWFPGIRVHRQAPTGEWAQAYAAIAAARRES